MSYNVNLESFQGPLDLLLHLIDKAEVDIYDVSISEITEQYLEYLRSMQSLELDIASEFIVMAATLLSIKSRRLLPKPVELVSHDDMEDDEIDPQLELINRLIEYKRFKKLAELLQEQESLRGLYMAKNASSLEPFLAGDSELLVEKTSVYDLVKAYLIGIQRQYYIEPLATIQKDEVTVEEKMEFIREYVRSSRSVNFSKLLNTNSVSEIVSTLLAILELIKNKEITCIQDNLFEDFLIIPVIGEH